MVIVARDLQPGERERMESALADLKQVLGGTDRDAIQEKTHALNHATRHLAEIVMNRSVREALAGSNVEEI